MIELLSDTDLALVYERRTFSCFMDNVDDLELNNVQFGKCINVHKYDSNLVVKNCINLDASFMAHNNNISLQVPYTDTVEDKQEFLSQVDQMKYTCPMCNKTKMNMHFSLMDCMHVICFQCSMYRVMDLHEDIHYCVVC